MFNEDYYKEYSFNSSTFCGKALQFERKANTFTYYFPNF